MEARPYRTCCRSQFLTDMRQALLALLLFVAAPGVYAGLINGDFEDPNRYNGWTDNSSHLGQGFILCDIPSCGTVNDAAAPQPGTLWARFGAPQPPVRTPGGAYL